jgi:hypothetical protein
VYKRQKDFPRFPFSDKKKTLFQNVRVQRVQDGKLGLGAESATGTSLLSPHGQLLSLIALLILLSSGYNLLHPYRDILSTEL